MLEKHHLTSDGQAVRTIRGILVPRLLDEATHQSVVEIMRVDDEAAPLATDIHSKVARRDVISRSSGGIFRLAGTGSVVDVVHLLGRIEAPCRRFCLAQLEILHGLIRGARILETLPPAKELLDLAFAAHQRRHGGQTVTPESKKTRVEELHRGEPGEMR